MMRELTEAGIAVQAASRAATEEIQLRCGEAARQYASQHRSRRLVSFYHRLPGGQCVKIESTVNGVLEVYATKGQRKTLLLSYSKPGKWRVLDTKLDTSIAATVRYS